MSDIGFRVEGSKAYVLRSGHEKEIPRETVLEIYQLVLGHLAPNRDYSAVTSIRKLVRIIDLECEPDESEDESDSESEEEPKPIKKKHTIRPAKKTQPKRKESSESEEESEEGSDDSE